MTSSTRKLSKAAPFAVAAAGLLSLLGCQMKQGEVPAQTSHAPLVVDEAMEKRRWPMSVAQYENGATVALPTASVFQHRAGSPLWQESLSDTPIFLANALTMPFAYLITPPWTQVVYPSGQIEASYNAMPPLDRQQ